MMRAGGNVIERISSDVVSRSKPFPHPAQVSVHVMARKDWYLEAMDLHWLCNCTISTPNHESCHRYFRHHRRCVG